MPTVRIGKTAKDRQNGAKSRNHANKLERAAWRNQSERDRDNRNFPFRTCNGKRNRHRWIARGNVQVIL